MKKLLPLVFIAFVATMFSCKDRTENDGKTLIIQDSLINIFPTWQALKIKVSEDRSQMDVIIGDATFYNASPEVKNQKAMELGKMVLRIYGKDSYLEKGRLVVTKDIHNNSETPADGIAIPINFAEMKKAGN
jgi:hypothetical protein